MRYEVITSRTTTITETLVVEVEADTPEGALLLAEALPKAPATAETQTSELTYAVECVLGTPKNIQACRRLLAAMSAKSKDADKPSSQPPIYDEAYFQFIDQLDKNG
jgi:hypothetical protein